MTMLIGRPISESLDFYVVTESTKIDRSQLMKIAWREYRKRIAALAAKGKKRSYPFKHCLSYAWRSAKQAISAAKAWQAIKEAEKAKQEQRDKEHKQWMDRNFPDTPLGRINWQIYELEMKDRFSREDHELYRRLLDERRRIVEAA